MRKFFWIGIAGAGFLLLVTAAQAGSVSNFYGEWKISEIAGYSDISSGDAGAAKDLGKLLIITSTSIMLPADLCNNHPLTQDLVNVNTFLRDQWQTSRSALNLAGFKLGKTAFHMDASCADALIIDQNDLLMTSGTGAVYVVKRQR
jgi:hypothetical protein